MLDTESLGGSQFDPSRPDDQITRAFLDAMASAGAHMDIASAGGKHPIADGKVHRADSLDPKGKGRKHIWYVLHADHPASGAFGHHKKGIQDTWTVAGDVKKLTKEERRTLAARIEQNKREHAEMMARMHAEAAAAAALIMAATEKASPEHAYLAKKGLPVFPGLRQLSKTVRYTVDGEEKTARAGVLVVPMFKPAGDATGKPELVGAQLINGDGRKLFVKGTAKAGSYCSVGKPVEGEDIYIAEGYATGARVHQAMGNLVFVAFDSGNLEPVAKTIRARYPQARLIFAADNDRFTTQPINNPGVTKAREAADAVGGIVVFPSFRDEEVDATDFDDLAQLRGLDAVRSTINRTLNPTAIHNDPPPYDEPSAYMDAMPDHGEAAPASDPVALTPRARRPEIRIVPGLIHEAVKQCLGVLANPATGIFDRAGTLVRPVQVREPSATLSVRQAPEGNHARPAGAIVIGEVSPEALVETLTERAHFTKWSERAKNDISINCPTEVARTILARRGHDWNVPRLKAIIRAPTILADGRIIDADGYDAESGLLLMSGRLWPKVPDTPTRRDAARALDILVEPIDAFPYVADADRSAALALMLTAVVRPMLRAAPLFAITAPAAGTGKSLIVDIASVLATGLPASVYTASRDDAEMEKRLGAAAIAGDAVVAIDNVSHPLSSDLLCQLLTQGEVQVRILGKSEHARIPSTALFCATGNGLVIAGDLNRRVIFIRLDARCERPDERTFKFSPVDLAMRKRGELVAAALTVIRAYLIAGTPNRATPMGNFEDWSDVVRSVLMWLNMPDPRETVAEMRSEDPERLRLAEIMEALSAAPFKVKEVRTRALNDEALRGALAGFIGRDGMLNASNFGAYLRARQNLIVDGRMLQLVRADNKNGSTWQVVSSSGIQGG